MKVLSASDGTHQLASETPPSAERFVSRLSGRVCRNQWSARSGGGSRRVSEGSQRHPGSRLRSSGSGVCRRISPPQGSLDLCQECRLASSIFAISESMDGGRHCDVQYDQFQEWVRSPAALEKLHRAEMSCGNSKMESELATAQRCILEARSTTWEPVYRQRLFQTSYWESPTYRLY
jgi:hypothetical protein